MNRPKFKLSLVATQSARLRVGETGHFTLRCVNDDGVEYHPSLYGRLLHKGYDSPGKYQLEVYEKPDGRMVLFDVDEMKYLTWPDNVYGMPLAEFLCELSRDDYRSVVALREQQGTTVS